MLRRLATLFVLLVSLSVALSAAAACMSVMHGDCCPPYQSCDLGEAPASMMSMDAPCCVAQPAPARTTVDVSGRNDHDADDLPAPDQAIAPVDLPVPRRALPERTADVIPVVIIDPQHLWLRTGRLRL